jgi:hypothetical protein
VSGPDVHCTHFVSTHFGYAGSLQSVAVVHVQLSPRHGPALASCGVPESSASSLGVTHVFRDASHT